jgi:hypothetical protein
MGGPAVETELNGIGEVYDPMSAEAGPQGPGMEKTLAGAGILACTAIAE